MKPLTETYQPVGDVETPCEVPPLQSGVAAISEDLIKNYIKNYMSVRLYQREFYDGGKEIHVALHFGDEEAFSKDYISL